MSWDSEFYAAVNTNSDFTDNATSLALEYKADASAPYAVYQLISADSTDDLSGVSNEGERRVQLTVWAASPTQAKQIAEYAALGAESALDVSHKFQRSLGRDPDEELFGFAIDFSIWFQNP